MIKWHGSSFVIFMFFVVRNQTIDANFSLKDYRVAHRGFDGDEENDLVYTLADEVYSELALSVRFNQA